MEVYYCFFVHVCVVSVFMGLWDYVDMGLRAIEGGWIDGWFWFWFFIYLILNLEDGWMDGWMDG